MDPIAILIPYVPVELLPVFILAALLYKGYQLWVTKGKDTPKQDDEPKDDYIRETDVKG